MTHIYPTPAARLWPRLAIRPNGCWEWTGATSAGRYGAIVYNGRKEGTHRVAWMLVFGPIPSGLFVCHRCDNQRCCNPTHLFLGTNADNMRDMYAKGRGPAQSRPRGVCMHGNPRTHRFDRPECCRERRRVGHQTSPESVVPPAGSGPPVGTLGL